MAGEPLLEVEGLTKWFPLSRSITDWAKGRPADALHAVDGVSVQVAPQEALGLIGESGSGKTTLGWTMARLHRPTKGTIRFEGQDITRLEGEKLRKWRRNVQVVFQDPVGSLDPRLKVWQIVGEPMRAQTTASIPRVRQAVAELLPTVGLPGDCLDQYAHEFSGGGRQRLSLARALSLHPKLIVLDEPTSALDVAVQAQILNRLVTLQRERGLAYILITHNVQAVRYVADRVAVMYLGQIVEIGDVHDVLERPAHPYTKALLAAVPRPDPRRRRARFRMSGEIPTMVHPPPGCRFAARCPFVIQRCRDEEPLLHLLPMGNGRQVACHRVDEVRDVSPETFVTPASPPPSAAVAPSSG